MGQICGKTANFVGNLQNLLKMICKSGHFHGNFLSKFRQKLICFAQLLIKKDSNFAIFGENDEIIIWSFNNNVLKKWANGKAFYSVVIVHFLQH